MSVAPTLAIMRTLGSLLCFLTVTATVGAVGCFLGKDDASSNGAAASAGDGVDTDTLLKSTLILETGCTATKVGPKHLLLAARCVVGNDAFAVGKTVAFKAASAGKVTSIADAGASDAAATDASAANDAGASEDAGPTDAGSTDAGKTDAGAKPSTKPTTAEKTFEVAEVKVNASYTSKCPDKTTCDYGKLEASDAKDIAVVILKKELSTIATIPVDFDAVGDGDSVYSLSSGCDKLDGTAKGLKVTKTQAAPAKIVNHKGSPYGAKPQLVTRLGGAYVVTAGAAWKKDGQGLCKVDIGAPLFRTDVAAVAGITSNFSVGEDGKLSPMTVHSTRVDITSKVGTWLKSLGVESTRSCSETEDGCVKKAYTGGSPSGGDPDTNGGNGNGGSTGGGSSDAGKVDGSTTSDGGTLDAGDGGVTTIPGDDDDGETTNGSAGEGQNLPEYQDESSSSSSDDDSEDGDEDTDAGKKKKKAKDEGGCAAAPGGAPVSGVAAFAGLAMVAALARRRRRTEG